VAPSPQAFAPAKVSVCIPTRNRKRYLAEAIRSVLDQTHPHFELIVSDNASTDGTPDLVKGFRDRRLRYLRHTDDRGMTANWLRAVEASSSPYVAILGDDDWWHPAFLAHLLPGLESNPAIDVAFCDHWLVDAAGALLRDDTERCSRRHGRAQLPGGPVPLARPALDHQSLLPTASIFRRDPFVALRVLNVETQTSPAYYIYGKLALAGSSAHYVPERLAYYRLHGSSATNTTVLRNWQDFQWACARLAQEFPPSTPGMGWVRRSWVTALETEGAVLLRLADWPAAQRVFRRVVRMAPFRLKGWLGWVACLPGAYRRYRWVRDRVFAGVPRP
jgi:glycosyltransferase involved in cell wall biosynthesis